MTTSGYGNRRTRRRAQTQQREGECDALVWLVGQSLPPALPVDVTDAVWAQAHERYWGWLGRQAARRAGAAGHDAARAAAERVMPRMVDGGRVARQVREVRNVHRIAHAPALITPTVRGTLARVLARARAVRAAPLIELGVAAGVGRALWDEPSDMWVALPPPPTLPDRRYVALRVVGDSMLPLLHSGDVVLVDLDGRPVPGSVVVARQGDGGGEGGGYVVKQVGTQAGHTLELRSLNPAYASTHIPLEGGHIWGSVVLRWCDHSAAR